MPLTAQDQDVDHPDDHLAADATMVPLLPTVALEQTEQFYTSLGFTVTYRQTRPYPYLAVERGRIVLHFGPAPKGLDPAAEHSGGAMVLLDDVAAQHAAIVAAMRAAHGKVLATGVPRVTRYRPGASRFSLVDPSGNTIIFVRRDEPEMTHMEYGGSSALVGLAKVLDNARLLSEFKNDDRATFRALSSGLRRHGATSAPLDQALALGLLIALGATFGEPERVAAWRAELAAVTLGPLEREEADHRFGGPELAAALADATG